MAKALYDNEQIFKNTIDQCIALANQHLAVDLYDVMYPEGKYLHHTILMKFNGRQYHYLLLDMLCQNI